MFFSFVSCWRRGSYSFGTGKKQEATSQDSTQNKGPPPGCVWIRTWLWYLVFTGTLVNFMITTNINIAIVDMVREKTDNETVSPVGECFMNDSIAVSNVSIISNDMGDLEPSQSGGTVLKFDWDERQQGMVLGSYFWLHSLLQLAGGVLANIYGTKKIFGFSNLAMCLLSLIIPVFANLGFEAIVVLRVLQGFIGGLSWPALHGLTANWIPPNERSKFVTSYMGSSVGTAVTFPLCGLLIQLFGWPSVFYTTGSLGVIWFIFWWVVVYDSPAQHPRISYEERSYIEDSLGQSVSETKAPTPWKQMFLSTPMWITILAQWGAMWSLFTSMTQAPTYFKFVHGTDVRMAGLLSGIPHLCRIIIALSLSHLCDWLLRNNKMSRTAVRKLATFVCCTLNGCFTLGLAFAKCNFIAAIICLAASAGMTGAVSSGPYANFVDISPNYAGILFGIGCTVADLPGFISPAIVGALTFQNQTPDRWKLVFLISAAMLIIPGVINICFGSSELQPWNFPEKETEMKDVESAKEVNNEKEKETAK